MAETSIVLNEDGTITAGATNGPLPLSVRGKWSYDGSKYNMVSKSAVISSLDVSCTLCSPGQDVAWRDMVCCGVLWLVGCWWVHLAHWYLWALG